MLMCFWHQIDGRKSNENADQQLSLYHWLRLLSVTDFDDILLSSVLKLTLHEPNYKEMEVLRLIRQTNSGLESAFFVLSSLARFVRVCIGYIVVNLQGSRVRQSTKSLLHCTNKTIYLVTLIVLAWDVSRGTSQCFLHIFICVIDQA